MPDGKGVVDKGDWFKVHHSGWLEGSLRAKQDIPIEITEDGDKLAAYRGVQTDLLALISRSRLRDGTLRHAEGIPMKRQWIANVLNISLTLLNAVIDDGVHDKNKEGNRTRIEIWEDGTIEFTNWYQYQAKKAGSNGSKPDNMPLTAEEKIQRQKQLAADMAYKYPNDAQTGIERKQLTLKLKEGE